MENYKLMTKKKLTIEFDKLKLNLKNLYVKQHLNKLNEKTCNSFQKRKKECEKKFDIILELLKYDN